MKPSRVEATERELRLPPEAVLTVPEQFAAMRGPARETLLLSLGRQVAAGAWNREGWGYTFYRTRAVIGSGPRFYSECVSLPGNSRSIGVQL
jgi:hypothetical protein